MVLFLLMIDKTTECHIVRRPQITSQKMKKMCGNNLNEVSTSWIQVATPIFTHSKTQDIRDTFSNQQSTVWQIILWLGLLQDIRLVMPYYWKHE